MDKILNFYDICSNKNPVFRIKDDEVCQILKFSNTNLSNLAAGYNKRLKIWELKRLNTKTSLRPVFDENIFNGPVNIIDWHPNQNYLLAACSTEKKINIYSVKEKIELLSFIFLPNFEDASESNDKLLKCYFIPGNGIIVVKEKRAFIFTTSFNYTEPILDLKFDFDVPVTHFKIMANDRNDQYFVYTDKNNNFKVRLYEFNKNIQDDITIRSFMSSSANIDKERGLIQNRMNSCIKDIEKV